MVVRVTGLDVLLATVENWLRGKQLCENAANRPDVCEKYILTHVRKTRINYLHVSKEQSLKVSPMALV